MRVYYIIGLQEKLTSQKGKQTMLNLLITGLEKSKNKPSTITTNYQPKNKINQGKPFS